ncbi:MAG: orotidine 5'-phosphate decarboxylase [Planctomycetes bacterium]|nr:orotidine 5'-phosphate decarboxylase [Planctomycetota bacterium]
MAKLQVALDFVDLRRALKAAAEAVAGGADILEAGTPLIKSEGLNSVRELKKRWPRIPIVADMKTMDAGRTEVESAAKAGAAIATVLGASNRSTIEECVEAGHNYGINISVDLLGVGDPVALAKACEEWGVHEVGVHTAIDEQMRGADPFEVLRNVREAVGVRVGVAGGINSETAAAAAEAGADVIVVGGAITKAKDVKAATETIKEVIRSLKPAETSLFRRVTAQSAREMLQGVSAPNISDAMHRSGDFKGLVRFSGAGKFVGRAITVRTYPGDWAKPVEAIDIAEPGDVIVIDAAGEEVAVWGELASESCLQRGIAGVIIDGAARDIDDIRKLGFTVWARYLNPTAGEPRGFGEINVPVVVGGVDVSPADWIVGDDTGLVRIPRAKLAEVTNRAMDCLEKENRIREEIREGSTLSAVTELLRWEKKT